MSSVTASATITTKAGKLKMVSLDDITTDGGTQMRERLDDSVVGDYSRMMTEGVEFPPIIAYFDGVTYWLADGFHRYFAATLAGHTQTNCEVRKGTKRDAILHAIGANREHGKQRSPEDKRRAVAALLKDEEWSTWPQTKIAEYCGVSQQLVSKVATDVIDASYHRSKMRTVTRGDQTYQQDTSKIGKSKPPTPAPEPEEAQTPTSPLVETAPSDSAAQAGEESLTCDQPAAGPDVPAPLVASEQAEAHVAAVEAIAKSDALGKLVEARSDAADPLAASKERMAQLLGSVDVTDVPPLVVRVNAELTRITISGNDRVDGQNLADVFFAQPDATAERFKRLFQHAIERARVKKYIPEVDPYESQVD